MRSNKRHNIAVSVLLAISIIMLISPTLRIYIVKNNQTFSLSETNDFSIDYNINTTIFGLNYSTHNRSIYSANSHFNLTLTAAAAGPPFNSNRNNYVNSTALGDVLLFDNTVYSGDPFNELGNNTTPTLQEVQSPYSRHFGAFEGISYNYFNITRAKNAVGYVSSSSLLNAGRLSDGYLTYNGGTAVFFLLNNNNSSKFGDVFSTLSSFARCLSGGNLTINTMTSLYSTVPKNFTGYEFAIASSFHIYRMRAAFPPSYATYFIGGVYIFLIPAVTLTIFITGTHFSWKKRSIIIASSVWVALSLFLFISSILIWLFGIPLATIGV